MSYFNYVINAFRKYESEYQSPIIHLVDRSFTVHTEKVFFLNNSVYKVDFENTDFENAHVSFPKTPPPHT